MTGPRRSQESKRFVQARPDQIDALSSMVRQDIVDAVAAIGPCSMTELADALGRAADGLYYHVRVLARVGLVVVTSPQGTGKKAARIDLPRRQVLIPYEVGSRRNKAAVTRLVANMLRSANRGFRKGFRPGLARVVGKRRNLWAIRARGRLSGADLEVVNRLLWELVRLMLARRRTKRAELRGAPLRVYELTMVLAPTPPSGSRSRNGDS
ncbi:MAG: winged helix-turn-helix domain-containing protein [Gemmatimonadaceae bacterium]